MHGSRVAQTIVAFLVVIASATPPLMAAAKPAAKPLAEVHLRRLGLAMDTPGSDGLGHARVGTLSVGGVVATKPLVEVFPTESLAPLIGPHDGVLSTAFFRDKILSPRWVEASGATTS